MVTHVEFYPTLIDKYIDVRHLFCSLFRGFHLQNDLNTQRLQQCRTETKLYTTAQAAAANSQWKSYHRYIQLNINLPHVNSNKLELKLKMKIDEVVEVGRLCKGARARAIARNRCYEWIESNAANTNIHTHAHCTVHTN